MKSFLAFSAYRDSGLQADTHPKRQSLHRDRLNTEIDTSNFIGNLLQTRWKGTAKKRKELLHDSYLSQNSQLSILLEKTFM